MSQRASRRKSKRKSFYLNAIIKVEVLLLGYTDKCERAHPHLPKILVPTKPRELKNVYQIASTARAPGANGASVRKEKDLLGYLLGAIDKGGSAAPHLPEDPASTKPGGLPRSVQVQQQPALSTLQLDPASRSKRGRKRTSSRNFD